MERCKLEPLRANVRKRLECSLDVHQGCRRTSRKGDGLWGLRSGTSGGRRRGGGTGGMGGVLCSP